MKEEVCSSSICLPANETDFAFHHYSSACIKNSSSRRPPSGQPDTLSVSSVQKKMSRTVLINPVPFCRPTPHRPPHHSSQSEIRDPRPRTRLGVRDSGNVLNQVLPRPIRLSVFRWSGGVCVRFRFPTTCSVALSDAPLHLLSGFTRR